MLFAVDLHFPSTTYKKSQVIIRGVTKVIPQISFKRLLYIIFIYIIYSDKTYWECHSWAFHLVNNANI